MGRAHTFLLGDCLAPGACHGRARRGANRKRTGLGTVVPTIPGVAERQNSRTTPAEKIVRKATADDLMSG